MIFYNILIRKKREFHTDQNQFKTFVSLIQTHYIKPYLDLNKETWEMNYIKDHQEIVHAVRNVKCCVELPVKSNLFSCPEEILRIYVQ